MLREPTGDAVALQRGLEWYRLLHDGGVVDMYDVHASRSSAAHLLRCENVALFRE
jgi:hypothetical protein